ncbi:MAG: ribbon-helix-helix domain-containing protein [Tepidisphaeraceae bacterium]
MGKGEKPILSVRIDAELLKDVDALAEEAGVGRAEIVERCLWLGLSADMGLASWLKGKVSGPVLQIMTHPVVLKALLSLTGDKVDPTVLKVRQGAIDKRRGHGKAKLAVE